MGESHGAFHCYDILDVDTLLFSRFWKGMPSSVSFADLYVEAV
jgi:hypothetical protein